MKFKKKCLFKNTNGSFGTEASAMESVWAYVYGSEDNVKTGRYRIRITKLESTEMAQLGMIPPDVEIPQEFFGMQANADIWIQTTGWIPCLDWVGDPNIHILEIESQLNSQIKSFLTGGSLDKEFTFDTTPPPQKKKPQDKPSLKVVQPPTESKSDGSSDQSDFDWI